MNMKNKGKLKENVLSTPCLGKACTGFAVTPPVSGDHDAAIARGVRFSHYWFPSSVACPSTHYATHRLTPLSWSWPPRHTTRQTLRRSNTHTHTPIEPRKLHSGIACCNLLLGSPYRQYTYVIRATEYIRQICFSKTGTKKVSQELFYNLKS